MHTSAFLLGFSLAFMGLEAGATGVGQALLEHLTLFERIAGVLLVVLGLRDMGLLGFATGSAATAREPTSLGLTVSLAAGAALTFGWTPLGGPVLDRILATATSADTIGRGVGLLSTYAVGRAVPLFVSGLALRAFLRRPVTAGAERSARKLISGGLVALTGTLIFAGLLPWIVARLVAVLPVA